MSRKSRVIKIGNVAIGGDNPVVVQSMTNTDTRDIDSTVEQIQRLEQAGCELVRVAVVDEEAARSIEKIKSRINIPLIADIHFDYRLALKSVEAGADGLRINPGNIGEPWKVQAVVKSCLEREIPIRIGVNAGSLDKKLLDRYGGVCAQAMVASALENINSGGWGFELIKFLEASSIILSLQAIA